MNFKKFFELAKLAGIEDAELYVNQDFNLSFSLFHGEVDNYSSNNGYNIIARGLYNGKFGTASCDVWNSSKAQYLVNEIVANARIIESEDPVFIFEGSKKYKKISTFNKELGVVSIDKKMEDMFSLEKKVKEFDSRIVEVEVQYFESMSTLTLLNSKGLKLAQKLNDFGFYASALVKEGEQTKNYYELFFDNDYSKVNIDDFAKKVAEGALSLLNGEPCPSGNYKAVLNQDVVKSFISFFVGQADAEEVQKNSSLFAGKLNSKVASNKLTVSDLPLARTLFARYFDDEGVATYNKDIIKNGVLKTYFYNLTTAAKDGVTTTGNGQRSGGKISSGPFYLQVKPGKKSLDQLFEDVKDGVYITEVQGLHAGLNAQSGNFSLQSTGYLIKDGKKDRCLDLITVSGNLMDLFNSIVEIGSDSKLFSSGVSAPSIYIKKLTVSGK